MQLPPNFNELLFKTGPSDFDDLAMALFKYQSATNPVYREYLRLLGVDPAGVACTNSIPFLPVSVFKSHRVVCSDSVPQLKFESSRTQGTLPSVHYIADAKLYKDSILKGFRQVFDDPAHWCFLCLLPSYLERPGASLVHMCRILTEQSNDKDSGFYLNEYKTLSEVLRQKKLEGKKCMLIGVSFSLLDLAEQYPQNLDGITVVETGGMKGRRREITRAELHSLLQEAFGLNNIGSEYGMTELLSQAWAPRGGLFSCPGWMRVVVRDLYDPYAQVETGASGGINIIDLANVHSCAFIETGDIGRMHKGGQFEVLGRLDHSETRGCNLMLES